MKRFINKLVAILALVGLALPTTLLTAPQSAYAALPVVSGGTTNEVVNGTRSVPLTNLTIVSQAPNDIVAATDIEISIETTATSANVQFDMSSVIGATDLSTNNSLATGSPVVTGSLITIPVIDPSVIDDSVVISGIKVKAGDKGTTDGFAGIGRLKIKTDGINESTTAFQVDAQTPVIKTLTSDAGTAGSLKIGDKINFTLTSENLETGASVKSDSYNGRVLEWTPIVGKTSTAIYTVKEGDADVTGLPLRNVIITDKAGNVSAPRAITDIKKTIDASKPQLFTNPTNVVHPAGANVPSEWLVVFQGNTDPGRMVYLTVNSDPVEHQTLSTPNGEWRFEVPAMDLGTGEHTATIKVADASGNENSYVLKFSVEAPVGSVRTMSLASATRPALSSSNVSSKDALTPQQISDSKKQELKDDVEKTAEGIINAAQTSDEDETNPWQTVVTVLAILIIAVGVGTAGYYTYEWWATRGQLMAVAAPAAIVATKKVKKTNAGKPVTKQKSKKSGKGKKSSNRW